MPNHESLSQGAGVDWKGGHLANYKPAYPLGNPRDAERIAKSSGRPMEDFLRVIPVEDISDQTPEVVTDKEV